MSNFEQPYPIRQRPDGWEVFLADWEDTPVIMCESLEEANHVADARPLNGFAMCGKRIEAQRVQACLAALHRHGIDARSLLVRRVMSLLA